MLADCIFCKIIQQIIPAKIIAQTSDLIVIADIAPKAKIHYLIIPKKHVPELLAINNSSQDLQIGSAIFLMAQELAKSLNIKDFRLITNNGSGAGQSVFHLHFHFLAGASLPGF